MFTAPPPSQAYLHLTLSKLLPIVTQFAPLLNLLNELSKTSDAAALLLMELNAFLARTVEVCGFHCLCTFGPACIGLLTAIFLLWFSCKVTLHSRRGRSKRVRAAQAQANRGGAGSGQ